MQQEQTEQKEYRKRILWLAEQMQYDDDIEESVVQFKTATQQADKEAKPQEPEGTEAQDDDDDDLMMDAEAIFIEKQSSHHETITVLDDDPKAKRRVT